MRINPGASDPKSQHPLNSLTVTLPVGSSVTWINDDSTAFPYPFHTIISGDPVKGPSYSILRRSL